MRHVVWAILDGHGEDAADIELDGGRLVARGRATNDDPEPYSLTYEVATGPRYVTESLVVSVERRGPAPRRLELTRSIDAVWSARLDESPVMLPDLAGALDCDLGRCPTTNSMPVLRERLLTSDEPVDFVMAWVQVPELVVRRSAQRYVPLGTRTDGRRRIQFLSLDSEFRAEITFDADGLVVDYTALARRISG